MISPTVKAFSFYILALILPTQAQDTPRAEPVAEELLADPAIDFFARGKNLYDSAQSSKEFVARRELYLRSADLFSEYISQFPNHPNTEAAWWYLGSSFYQAGLLDDAKHCFCTLLNQYGEGKFAAAAAYTLAADHYNKGEFQFSAPLFERFAKYAAKASDKPKGHLFAGNSYRQLGRDREAISSYLKVIEDPACGIFRQTAEIEIGKLNLKAGKIREALSFFEKVIASDAPAKYRGEAAFYAATACKKLGESPSSEKYLRLILSSEGMEDFRADAQISLMDQFVSQKEYQAALDIYQKSTLKAEGEKEALRLMLAARSMMYLNKTVAASELFREVERLVKPENELAFQAAYYRLNCFFQIEGKHVLDQIDAFLQIYEPLRPKDTRIHTALLMKAETQFSQNATAEAAKTYSKIDPGLLSEANRPGFLYQRGWCFAEAGDAAGAIRSMSEFLTKHPNDKRAFPAIVKRAKAHADVGEANKAVSDYDRITSDAKAPKDLVALSWLESARTRRKEGNIEDMLVRYKGLLNNVAELSDNIKAEANYWIGWGMVKSNKPIEATPFLNKARELRAKAYAKDVGRLLALSHYTAQNNTALTVEIKRAIDEEYIEDIPAQAIQWSGLQAYNAANFADATLFLTVVANFDEPRATQKEVWRYLAKALLETKKPEAALDSIKHLLDAEENPAWRADAILDRSRAMLALKRYVESRKSADEALALRPQGRTSAYLRIVSGDLDRIESKLGEAAAHYLYVINFHEDADLKPLAMWNYIQVLEAQNKLEEAAAFKERLAKEFPEWKAPKIQ